MATVLSCLGRLSMVLLSGTSLGGTATAECIGFPIEHHIKYADLIFRGVVTDSEYDRAYIDAKDADVFGVRDCWNAISIGNATDYLKKLGRGCAPK